MLEYRLYLVDDLVKTTSPPTRSLRRLSSSTTPETPRPFCAVLDTPTAPTEGGRRKT
jgi:hypothetical protein